MTFDRSTKRMEIINNKVIPGWRKQRSDILTGLDLLDGQQGKNIYAKETSLMEASAYLGEMGCLNVMLMKQHTFMLGLFSLET